MLHQLFSSCFPNSSVFIELFEDQAGKLSDVKVHVLGFLGMLYSERLLADGNRKVPVCFHSKSALLVFCGDHLSVAARGVLKSLLLPIVVYFPFMCQDLLIVLGAPGLGCMYLQLFEVPDEDLAWTLLFWVSS